MNPTPNTTPVVPTTPSQTLWTVAWTGGWEDPTFQSFTDEDKAQTQYDAWVAEANDSSDRIHLIQNLINSDGTVVTLKVAEFSSAVQDIPEGYAP